MTNTKARVIITCVGRHFNTVVREVILSLEKTFATVCYKTDSELRGLTSPCVVNTNIDEGLPDRGSQHTRREGTKPGKQIWSRSDK